MTPPSVGRTVHFVAVDDGACCAAIITKVEHTGVGDVVDAVSLFVMLPDGTLNLQGVPFDEQQAPGSWHWPERVE